jgi:hypothetical protein
VTGKERREQTIRLAFVKPHIRRRIIRHMTWQDLLERDADYECWIGDGPFG